MKLLLSVIVIYMASFVPGMENRSSLASEHAVQKDVPIKGTYTTTSQFLSGPPMVQVRITGTGQSSHLGQGTFVALSMLNLSTPPPFVLSGTATFYAANGDEFYTSFEGTSTPNTDGTSTVEMTHTVTGGSGRFENASGNFTGLTITNLSIPQATITYEGYISY